MDQQTPIEDNKSLLRNDSLLVCGILTIYGICILGLIGATLWGLTQRSNRISANATSTANAIATQQANTAATTVAYSTEQAQYQYVIHFNQNYITNWYIGQYNDETGNAKVFIRDGVYVWKIIDSKGRLQVTDLRPTNKVIEDFDVYIDSKFIDSPAGTVCSGLSFRKSALGWDDGAYVFTICNDSRYKVRYYQAKTWETITVNYYDAIQHGDWNRIGISARGNHFTFTINNLVVFEMTDERRKIGGLGIFIEVEDNNSAEIWFDNFGFQTR